MNYLLGFSESSSIMHGIDIVYKASVMEPEKWGW